MEFWAAIVLDFAEVPANMFTSMFTCARTGGWSAHILEQKTTGRLIRPSAIYTGPGERKASEIERLERRLGRHRQLRRAGRRRRRVAPGPEPGHAERDHTRLRAKQRLSGQSR